MISRTVGPRIAYVHLGSPHAEYTQVVVALADRGATAVRVHLDDIHAVDWATFDAVNLRMCRGFHRRPDFLQRIQELDVTIPILNPLRVAVGTLDKRRYLTELEQDGVAVIQSRWISAGEDVTIDGLMTQTGWDHLVIKPTISAGSWRTFRVSRSGRSTSSTHFVYQPGHVTAGPLRRDAEPERLLHELLASRDVCVQPFLSSVLVDGELSFVFIGGKLSHTVRKMVGHDGGWWAHERLGGYNEMVLPTPDERAWAHGVHEALEYRYGPLAFGRIDGLRDEQHVLRLLECELVIPRLLLSEGRAYDTYASIILREMGR